MPGPASIVSLADILAGIGGYALLPVDAGDFNLTAGYGLGGTPFAAGVADLTGDGIPEVIVGAPGSDDKAVDAGRIFLCMGSGTATVVETVGDWPAKVVLDGVSAGDMAGLTVGSIGDLSGDGKADLLIGGPGVARGTAADAGFAYVAWSVTTGGVDLADVSGNAGAGYALRGEAAGDAAGSAMAAIADLNGDLAHRPEVLVGAPGNDAGGTDAGAAYVAFGKSTSTSVNLSAVAGGTGGFKIIGESAGDAAGSALAAVGDMNGDGLAEILVGAPGNDAGGTDAGAAYIVFGKATTTAVNLDNVALGTGGFRITGPGDYALAGAMLAAAGDLDGDGRGDFIIGAPGIDTAYVVFGKAGTAEVNLADVEAGAGGFAIHAEAYGDLTRMALAGGRDLNRDGIADIVIGAPDHGTGGAVYVIWGGGTGTVDLAQIALGRGGALIEGEAGGHAGASVAIQGDMNGDGAPELIIGSTGTASFGGVTGESVAVVFAPADWVPDYNVYGSDGDDTIVTGYGGAHKVGDGADAIFAFAGNDSVAAAGGDDSVEAGEGNDTVDAGSGADTVLGEGGDDSLAGGDDADSLDGGAGADVLDGGAGDDVLDGGVGPDTMAGGTGDDTYFVDDAGDVVTELPGEGSDTIIASVDTVLPDEVEALVLAGSAHAGTGNGLANLLIGTAGADSLDGAGGADTMEGGAGDDTYAVDSLGDVVTEAPGGGRDTVVATVSIAVLPDEVEDLVLAAPGLSGTGNGLDNRLTGSTGSETLDGGAGSDTIDGGAGADLMIGGAGDDLFRVDDPGDVVVELGGGGNDTVEVSGDWTIADNIETVVLKGGTAHRLTGNAGDNGLVGSTGNDTLDGGAGDDAELGGEGDDVLVSGAGHDTLAGGGGNDRFVVKGGRVHIEDLLGHDTLDASEASGDSYIDLSAASLSHIGGEDCEIGLGGTTVLPLDVQFLQDLTGSFADDIATVRGLVPQIVTALQAVQPNAEFGVSSFRDKDYGVFGGAGDYVYSTDLALTTQTLLLTDAYTAMVATGGADLPECQLEALMQLALRTAAVGFRATSARFVVLFTDATYHTAADGLAAGLTTPNNGDAILDGNPAGTGENYPEIAQLKAALEAANIVPIFAVAGATGYDTLVTALGRGTVVALTANSDNVVSAITSGLNAVTVTRIEDAVGGAGNDTLTGSDDANRLTGGNGNDLLSGGLGNDTMDGGAGNDRYEVDSLGDLIIDASGIDTVVASLDWTLKPGVENLELTGGALKGTGNNGANLITGNALGNLLNGAGGNDTLDAGDGADVLKGGKGDDLLLGGLGSDHIDGQDGNDTLVGGEGADRLTGGLGADVFRFLSAAEGGDRLQDFATGLDWIELSAAGFGGGLAKDMVLAGSNHLVHGTKANAATGQVLVDDATGRIFWDADGTGHGAKVLVATLATGLTIADGDFHVIA